MGEASNNNNSGNSQNTNQTNSVNNDTEFEKINRNRLKGSIENEEEIESNSGNSEGQEQATDDKLNAQDVQEIAKSGASLAKNAATGNVVGAAKDALNLAKNKKLRNKMIRHAIIQFAAPFLLIIFLAAAVLGIFGAVADTVGDVLGGIGQAIVDFFTVDNTDGAIIVSDEQIDTIINAIEEQGISTEDLKLLGDYDENASDAEKQRATRKYIRKFYEAQAITETLNYYHRESTDNKTYGAIYVYRANGDVNEDISNRQALTYISYDRMQEMVSNNNRDAAKYFSIDDSDNLVIASVSETIVETGTSEAGLAQQSRTYTVVKRPIDYKSLVSQYTTKMNFLIDLTLISQNPEFVSAVVDLIKDSRIEITIMDNTTTKVKTETNSYTLNVHVEADRGATPGTSGSYYNVDESYERTEVTRTTTITRSPAVKVNHVKTWFCEQTIEYAKKTDGPNEITNSTTTAPNETPPEGDGNWKTNQTTTIVETSTTESYEETSRGDVSFEVLGQQGDGERYANGEIDEPTFVGLMETEFRIPYSTREEAAGTNLYSGAEMLFYLLQKDADLQNMETIMRYALYLYSGRDFGVTELDGSIFEIREFTSTGMSVDNALAEFLKSYENEALRTYVNGSSSNYSAVSNYVSQDKTKYRMYYTSFDGCLNFSYGIMVRNSDGVLNNASYFSAEGIDLQSLINQYNSGQDVYVDVEIIDRIFLNILNDKKNALKETIAKHGVTMESHQIDALVSVAYQYGNCGQYISGSDNIAELYKTYYQAGDTNGFRNRAQAQTENGGRANFFIGSNYAERKEATWTLFNEGRYILSDGTEIRSSAAVVEFALQFVGEGPSRFTGYNPTNGVPDIWTGGEWCAMFVSYCFNECGLIPDILPTPYAGCGLIYDLYNQGNSRVKIVGNRGVFAGVPKDNYTPSPGDIIFFNWGNANVASHTGIVVSCDGTNVYTIEGNTGNGSSYTSRVVSQSNYSLNSPVIVGYISING